MSSKLSRRRLFEAGVATMGVAALPKVASAQEQPAGAKEIIEGLSENYPAGAQSQAAFLPLEKMTAPDLKLSQTFSLGKSTLDEGAVITASRWGVVRAHVKGGKLTHLTPFEFDYAPSVNLNGLAELPYSPSRIRYPMVRESYLKYGPKSRSTRGQDRFVRVSWDTALDLVAKEIKRTYDNYGPSAVFGNSYGWMSTGKIHAASSNLHRLLNLCGGYLGCVNSYSTAAIGTIMPYVVGSGEPQITSWDNVVQNSQRVVFWGCDPIVTNDIDWFTTIHNSAGYLRALKAKGTKTIAINPLKPDTAEYLNSQWIAPRPGTDCAMMLGMIYELVTSGKANMDFINRCTYGWKEFSDYLMGKTDGTPKTLEWASKECGVPAQTIKDLAHELQSNRTMLMVGWGIQRIQYGEQPHWMAFALASVLGQIGLPGGGIGTSYHYSNGGSPTASGPFLGGLGGGVNPVWPIKKPWKGSQYIPVARFADCFLNPGKTIDHNGQKITYPEIKLVMWAGGNPFTHQPDTNNLANAWKKPDTVIVTDIVWSATARHADIVLPACTTFERNDITSIGSYSNDGIVAMQQAIEPRWESKSDFWICANIAKKLGLEEPYTLGLDEMGWIRRTYDQARSFGARGGINMPSFEEFWQKGYVMFPVSSQARNFVAYENFRKDPEGYGLPTESGKIQLFSPTIASFKYDDCRGYPSYFRPSEGVNTKTKETPLALMACKSRYRLHSQLDGTTSHNFANIENREPCWIHPEDAKARGIENGDVVLVKNKRGMVLAGAYVTERVMPGVVVIHHGAWYDPQNVKGRNIDVHGNSNTLTMDVPTSKLACGNIASTALVQVEKWTESLPRVSVYEEPEFSPMPKPVRKSAH